MRVTQQHAIDFRLQSGSCSVKQPNMHVVSLISMHDLALGNHQLGTTNKFQCTMKANTANMINTWCMQKLGLESFIDIDFTEILASWERYWWGAVMCCTPTPLICSFSISPSFFPTSASSDASNYKHAAISIAVSTSSRTRAMEMVLAYGALIATNLVYKHGVPSAYIGELLLALKNQVRIWYPYAYICFLFPFKFPPHWEGEYLANEGRHDSSSASLVFSLGTYSPVSLASPPAAANSNKQASSWNDTFNVDFYTIPSNLARYQSTFEPCTHSLA